MRVDPLQFSSEQLERASKGLEVAALTGNVQLFALNARQIFKHNHMRGLIVWRRQVDPTPYLARAIVELSAAMGSLRRLEPTFDLHANLPLGRMALLARLTGNVLTERIAPAEDQPVDLQIDLLLSQGICNRSRIEPLLSALSQNKHSRLAAETYRNYFDLLDSKGNDARIEELARVGEDLYLRRSTDQSYSGGEQTEGGGPDNKLVVDYRLAIALRASGAKFMSQHSWRWPSSAA